MAMSSMSSGIAVSKLSVVRSLPSLLTANARATSPESSCTQ